jgi:hypothetical protein
MGHKFIKWISSNDLSAARAIPQSSVFLKANNHTVEQKPYRLLHNPEFITVLSISHTGSYSELDKSSPHPKTLFV